MLQFARFFANYIFSISLRGYGVRQTRSYGIYMVIFYICVPTHFDILKYRNGTKKSIYLLF